MIKKLENKIFLVVDDEPGICMSLAMWLRNLGAQVFTASDGEQAFGIAQREKLDLILSDVRMPGGDGIALLEKIRMINPLMPAFLLATGYSEISEQEAVNKGAQALLLKPIDFDLLEKKMTELLLK